MLTRTRNELLVGGALTLVIGALGFHLRGRLDDAPHDAGAAPGTVTTEAVDGDRCPTLTSWVASPLQTSVGSWIDVGAAAVDDDPGEIIAYAWAPAADFAAPRAPKTRYRCPSPGRHLLTLSVSDDHRPRPCTTAISIAVECVAR
jgi:hypothetical protein